MQAPIRRFAALGVALLAGATLSAPTAVVAQTISTPASHAYMVDLSTGTVLLEKNARTPMAPASMSKLMTTYMIMERLKNGSIGMEDTFNVSRKAWKKGGSKMFVRVNTRVKVQDLLRGIIVQSGNDACIVIAEGLSGTEDAFAAEMTKKAQQIGLEASTFRNSTGWPDPNHRMSARDIAVLSTRIIENFPEYYSIYSERTFTYSGIKQGNRNPLLYIDGFGADGLKTGHTEESGYGLAASAQRGDRRLVLVVNGLKSVRDRRNESARLLDWGFRNFKKFDLFHKGQELEMAETWLGSQPTVPLVIDQDVRLTLPRASRKGMKATVTYNGPIAAPIEKGQVVGKLVLTAPGAKTMEYPLKAGEAVGQLGLFGRLGAALRHIIFGAS